ncbi:MAG: hypothetical protein KY455_07335 [Euryarchaeota archaeon]|nr:hypothetical protein [Euryarchaeota archaeon]
MPLLRPCKNTAAFEALPDRPLQVDLDRLESVLVGAGWSLVVNAAVMLIVRKETEVSVYRSGKVLIKTRDPDEALGVYRAVFRHVQEDAPDDPQVEGLDRLARKAKA